MFSWLLKKFSFDPKKLPVSDVRDYLSRLDAVAGAGWGEAQVNVNGLCEVHKLLYPARLWSVQTMRRSLRLWIGRTEAARIEAAMACA